MQDELRTAGDVVAVFFRTTDEEIARAQHLIHPHALSRAGPFAQLPLDGNVRDDPLVLILTLIVFPLPVQDCYQLFELVATGLFRIGGYDSNEPLVLISHIA